MGTDKVFCFVFARGGSKGLPGKNLLEINGIPLIGHSIKLASELSVVDKIFVSSDSSKILACAEELGAEVIQRPDHLATDQASEWLAWQHAVRYVQEQFGQFDCFLSLPATSPLRSKSDVVNCINALKSDVDIVMTMTDSNRNPWFNMVNLHDQKYLRLVNYSQKKPLVHRRQDAPKCFDLTTVAYVARPDFILSNDCLWAGNVAGVKIPPERSIDIDTNLDFQIARFLMEEYQYSEQA